MGGGNDYLNFLIFHRSKNKVFGLIRYHDTIKTATVFKKTATVVPPYILHLWTERIKKTKNKKKTDVTVISFS